MYVFCISKEISVHDFCVKAFNLYAHFKHEGAKVKLVKIILLVLWFNTFKQKLTSGYEQKKICSYASYYCNNLE